MISRLFLFCMALHLALILCHLILVAVGRDGHPLHLVHETWYTDVMWLAASYGPNMIGKGYLVLLLYVTQKLALRRNLNSYQSLTATHDKSQAWLGLGPAIPVLFYQLDTAADALGIWCILAYLGGTFILGITTPILFTMGEVNNNADRFFNITNILPSVGNNISALMDAFPVIEILPLLDLDVQTYGLEAFLIYDIPNFSGWQTVHVDATQVGIDCQALPNAIQNGGLNEGIFNFTFDPEVEDLRFVPIPNSINILPLVMKDQSVPPPPTFIVASTIPVVDDTTNTSESVVHFAPSVVLDACLSTPAAPNCAPISSVQLLACNVDMWNVSNVGVQPLIGTSDIPSAFDQNDTVWKNWQLSEGPIKPLLTYINSFPSMSPFSDESVIFRYEPDVSSSYGYHNLTSLEANVIETLNYAMDGDSYVSLMLLQVVLEMSVALVYWRAAMSTILLAQEADSVTFGSQSRYNVQINGTAPLIGLFVSVAMLALATYMTRPVRHTDRKHKELGELGVLQLTWLLGNWPRTQELRGAVAEPTLGDLRRAGTQIQVEGWQIRPDAVRMDSDEKSVPGDATYTA